MSESYQHVVKGGLKLKGGAGLPAAGGVGKKKKKKSKAVGKEIEEAPLELTLEGDDGGEDGEGGGRREYKVDHRTAAEVRYDEQMQKTQEKLIHKMASKSHRDKVRDFNEYLSKLSEHHDIPKVGPG
mmetsp:Transcript_4387/g.6862  ORF Transcript_4387/g.6862 Transcript_4387/m.6862 type:complete len:127 (-) Transcript_4387:66-446(-)